MKKLFMAAVLATVVCGCNEQKFPNVAITDGSVVVAHRGYWNCEAAGFSENSIASLKAAQDSLCWGSECDIRLTRDGVVIVNHNKDINGKIVEEYDFEDFTGDLLPNGERRPTLDEYIEQAKVGFPGTKLIIELKSLSSEEKESLLVEKTFKALKAHGAYDPKNIIFITFSHFMCRKIATEAPEFANQYLNGDIAPADLALEGINGIDYETNVFKAHPEWIEQSRALGMSTNVWTVNKPEDIKYMIGLGVGAITTNCPTLAQKLIAESK